MRKLQDAGAAASTQVRRDEALLLEALQRSQVASGDIRHMDIISNARSVGRVVVRAKQSNALHCAGSGGSTATPDGVWRGLRYS